MVSLYVFHVHGIVRRYEYVCIFRIQYYFSSSHIHLCLVIILWLIIYMYFKYYNNTKMSVRAPHVPVMYYSLFIDYLQRHYAAEQLCKI